MPVELLRNQHKKNLDDAKSYEEWKEAAIAYDKANGMELWKSQERSSLYDNESIRKRLGRLVELREAEDAEGLLFTLNEGIHGNIGSMGNPALYRRARYGTKNLIHDYIGEIVDALHYLANVDDERMSFEERLDFFRRASHCYGRPALMLSGAGSLGFFHLGVVHALFEQDLLPDCISGSSAGAVVAGMLGCNDDKQIRSIIDVNRGGVGINQSPMIRRTKKIDYISKFRGVGVRTVEEAVNAFIPDITFQEAYEISGRYINISVAPSEKHQTSRLLNATTSPNILVRSAVLASCAVPGVYPPRKLMCKNSKGETVEYLSQRKWIDGSITDDLPSKRLARLYGVNYFIASQANPVAVPLMTDPKGDTGLISTLYRYSNHAVKAMIDMNYQLVHRYIPNKDIEHMLGLIQSVVGQNYTGDVTIAAKLRPKHYLYGLSAITESEAAELFRLGEKSTWPKIEMIRNCTVIGDLLLKIRTDYESSVMGRPTLRPMLAANE